MPEIRSREFAPLVAAAVVVIAITAVIAVFGVRRLPEVPAIGQPAALDLPGRIAFRDDDDGCVSIVAADGSGARVSACDEEFDRWSPVSWTDSGYVAVRSADLWEVLILIDPDTGEIAGRLRDPDHDQEHHSPPHDIVLGGTDGAATVGVQRGLSVDELYRLEGPTDYGFRDADRSPDGRYILLTDSEGRLLVVPVDDPEDARLLPYDGVDSAAWGA